MRKHLPTIALSLIVVVLVGITAVKAYSAVQNITVTGDLRLDVPPDSVTVQGNAIMDSLGATVTNPLTEGRTVMSGDAFDVVGDRTGTSVTGVYFGSPNVASSVYAFLLDPLAERGAFTIGITDASSTAAVITFGLLASNDTSCDTATTSSETLNAVLTTDINWFDAGDLILGATQDNPLDTATSSIGFAPSFVGQNRQIIVDKLNSRCLALEVNGSSTAAWIQFKANSKP